jgi:hypothetical protein
MVVIQVHIGRNTIDDVLLDGGSEVNIITILTIKSQVKIT